MLTSNFCYLWDSARLVSSVYQRLYKILIKIIMLRHTYLQIIYTHSNIATFTYYDVSR